MAEYKSLLLQLPDTQVVAVMPVVPQRTVHGGIAVIRAFPDDGDGTGQLEIHIGVIYPASSGIHGFTEYLTLDGLEDIRQLVFALFSQPVDKVLKLVAYLFPYFPQSLEPKFDCQRKNINGGRTAHQYRLAHGSDGGKHGSGGEQRLAHFLGLSFPGNRRYAHDVAGERRMCQCGTRGAIRQYGRAAHPHLRFGHAADQRSRMQDECREMQDADARLRYPLVMHLYRRSHALEHIARHSRHPLGNGRQGNGYLRHDIRHQVIHLAHVGHGHDGRRRRNRRVHVYPYGKVTELGDRHTRHGRQQSSQPSLNLVKSFLGACKKVGEAPSGTTTTGSTSYHVAHI